MFAIFGVEKPGIWESAVKIHDLMGTLNVKPEMIWFGKWLFSKLSSFVSIAIDASQRIKNSHYYFKEIAQEGSSR